MHEMAAAIQVLVDVVESPSLPVWMAAPGKKPKYSKFTIQYSRWRNSISTAETNEIKIKANA